MTTVRCRLMTFNVRYDTAADGDNAWERRRSHVASVVRFHAPDLVGLQEPLAHQYAYLREHLSDYDWEGTGRVDGDAEGEHCPVGWRHDRVRAGQSGTVWLSETPQTPGTSYPEAGKPRLVTWMQLWVDGRPLFVCNTHFDHRSEEARIKSAEQIRRLVAGLRDGHDDLPVVVLGDFNCTPESDPYRLLTTTDDVAGTPLTDAKAAAEFPHHGPTATFEQFTGAPDRKIDHIFVTDEVAVRQHGVVADHWDGHPPSDHRPVIAELVLRE